MPLPLLGHLILEMLCYKIGFQVKKVHENIFNDSFSCLHFAQSLSVFPTETGCSVSMVMTLCDYKIITKRAQKVRETKA